MAKVYILCEEDGEYGYWLPLDHEPAFLSKDDALIRRRELLALAYYKHVIYTQVWCKSHKRLNFDEFFDKCAHGDVSEFIKPYKDKYEKIKAGLMPNPYEPGPNEPDLHILELELKQ